MRIVVCIKQVVDTNDIKWTKNNTLDREGVESVVNPCDLKAIETALTIKDSNPNTHISVVTMGPQQATSALKTALALGCDEAFLVCDKKFSGADTVATSRTLAAAIKKAVPDFDLIICGQYATDGDTAQTGPSIAQKLNIEQITYVDKVQKVTYESEKSIIALRKTDTSNEIIKTPLPALICMDYPEEIRNITINGYLKAQDTPLTTLSLESLELNAEDVGIKGSPTYVSKAFRAVSTRDNELIENKTNEEIVNLLQNTVETVKEGGVL